MHRKPYFVLLTLLVLAAGLVLVIAQKPGEAKGEPAAQTALPPDGEEVTQAAESLTPAAPAEVEMSAVQVREALLERAKRNLFKPGWVLVRETFTDFTKAEDYVVVPMNGQIIPKNWVRETWLLVDEGLQVKAMFSEKKMLDGTIVSLTRASDGFFGKTLNAEILPNVQIDYWTKTETMHRLIEQGETQEVVFQFLSLDGKRILHVVYSDVFPSPVRMDGLKQPLISFTTEDYYDWQTGQFLFSEGWATLTDDSRQLVGRLEMIFDFNSTPPESVLEGFSINPEE
ncbi:MAG: hypothetical protein ACK4SN_07305 [Bellilinea sp.]